MKKWPCKKHRPGPKGLGAQGAQGGPWGLHGLPYGVLTDENGVISSLGIVNSREHLESLFEARKLGVGSIQEYLEQNSTESENSKNAVQEYTAEGAES